MEYGYKEHGGIGTDEIKESVKRRTGVEYHVVDGRMPCAIAVITNA